MKRLLVLMGLLMVLVGCNPELTFTEIEIGNANKEVREFIGNVQDKNGNYLYFAGEKEMYVFLNGKNVEQGGEVLYFTDVSLNASGDTLNVRFNEKYTNEYSNKDLQHQVLYKIQLDKEYDKILAFANGEEVGFHVVGSR